MQATNPQYQVSLMIGREYDRAATPADVPSVLKEKFSCGATLSNDILQKARAAAQEYVDSVAKNYEEIYTPRLVTAGDVQIIIKLKSS